MFWNKKNEEAHNTGKNLSSSDEYDRILKRLSERDADISAIKATVAYLELELKNLRGKMSAKLRDLQKEYNQEQEEKDLNDDLVPYG